MSCYWRGILFVVVCWITKTTVTCAFGIIRRSHHSSCTKRKMIEKIDYSINSDVGIYSLCCTNHSDDTLVLYAGTKRGNILSIPIQNSTTIITNRIKTRITNSSFPIYSMAWKNGILACGGGDRYVTLYDTTTLDRFTELQRLGPHTGWVKDTCFHSNNDWWLLFLFSLGCNCVETWKLDKNNKSDDWNHESTIRMNSCPTYGTTLSSDLLCTSTYQKYLFVGGVDGRIHLLDTSNSNNILSSIPAHDGRVNQLLVLSQINMLCSIGHDGTFQCRRIINDDDDDGIMMISPTSDIQYEWKEERLLTMSEIITSDNNDNKVAIPRSIRV